MRILLVAATSQEIEPLLAAVGSSSIPQLVVNSSITIEYKSHLLTFLVTSVGMVATAFELGRHLQSNTYDLVLNVGICGAINRQLQLGEAVNVVSDCIYELGAEDGDDFLQFEQLNLPGKNKFQNKSEVQNNIINTLKKVSGITVNTVHGSDASISKIKNRMEADVESMEGAAFLYAMESYSTPYFQIRAISNFVEKRDRNKWQIPLAITNLNNKILELLNSL